jgi:hypothetical protein
VTIIATPRSGSWSGAFGLGTVRPPIGVGRAILARGEFCPPALQARQIDAPVSKTRNDPIDMLHFLIDECGHTQAELGDLLGSRPRASEILNRKRALTVEMIYKISKAWKVPAKILIKPYQLKAA